MGLTIEPLLPGIWQPRTKHLRMSALEADAKKYVALANPGGEPAFLMAFSVGQARLKAGSPPGLAAPRRSEYLLSEQYCGLVEG